MPNYLRPQTVGEVLRNAAQIYFRNFGVIFVTFFVLVFPFNVFQNEAQVAKAWALMSLAAILSILASCIAWGALTIAVSDICLGNKPSVSRSYQKIFGPAFGRLLLASLLQTLSWLIGFILCIVPGVIAMLWFMFTPPVVMLEGLGGTKALQRSKRLGQGFFGRNFLVVLLLMIIGGVVGGIVGGIAGGILEVVHQALHMELAFILRVLLIAVQTLITSFSLIALILLYYDLRARKEAYDAAALAEDLRR
jgi:hypothetical protein